MIVLNFLLSPLGTILFFCIVIFTPIYFYSVRSRERNKVLKDYFKGTYSFLQSDMKFNFEGNSFHLGEQGSGAITFGQIRHKSILWGYVETQPSFFCANEEVVKYVFDQELGSSQYRKKIEIKERNILIGSESKDFLKKIEDVLRNNKELSDTILELLINKNSYVRVRKEIHVGSGLISRKCVFRYSGFAEPVYKDPSVLKSSIVTILSLFKAAGISLMK